MPCHRAAHLSVLSTAHGNFVADTAHLGFFHIAKTLEMKAEV